LLKKEYGDLLIFNKNLVEHEQSIKKDIGVVLDELHALKRLLRLGSTMKKGLNHGIQIITLNDLLFSHDLYPVSPFALGYCP